MNMKKNVFLRQSVCYIFGSTNETLAHSHTHNPKRNSHTHTHTCTIFVRVCVFS
jgi:hypothetical protein